MLPTCAVQFTIHYSDYNYHFYYLKLENYVPESISPQWFYSFKILKPPAINNALNQTVCGYIPLSLGDHTTDSLHSEPVFMVSSPHYNWGRKPSLGTFAGWGGVSSSFLYCCIFCMMKPIEYMYCIMFYMCFVLIYVISSVQWDYSASFPEEACLAKQVEIQAWKHVIKTHGYLLLMDDDVWIY